ncbi:MAG: thiamine phosphate synthase [Actinobacteria bacterium HGW-Actinobacteria-5]|jgi:thiamine-phosphate pyrophosphorylase|nr:MAG: thiamine phosphate synthase [Actinobacteria bacterium HGW-Actinobacteria-5]
MTALLGLATRLGLARLLLITGTRTEQADLAAFADACFAGGVDLMQLRDPSADHDQLLTALTAMRKVALHYQGLVAVYGSAPLAQEFGADVLHLPERGIPAAEARGYLHEWALVGRSCHSRGQVDAALADPNVNYLNVGPVFGGLTQDGGLDLVRHAAEVAPPGDAASKPWFAVGGITAGTLDQVLAAGARRISVSRAITSASDPEAAAISLKDRLRHAWNEDPAMANLTLQVFRHHE